MSFNLFDRSPHAWAKVRKWSSNRGEFQKRTAFALLWSLAIHDRHADDESFLHGLTLVERAAVDERHFVKKAVNMALRAVGKRNPALNVAALASARRLAASKDVTAQWIGRHAFRELTSASVQQRIARRVAAPPMLSRRGRR